MNDTVEELETKLQEMMLNMDNIAQKVQDKELDAYTGFMESEKYKNANSRNKCNFLRVS